MISHWHYAFSVGLLVLYLVILARWHGGRYPRVVSGPADFAFLTFGIGGLVLFGPIGQTLARILFDKPNALDWLALASGMTLAALLISRRAWRRLVVYHVDAATLDRVLEELLTPDAGHFVRTIHGFEDPVRRKGIRIEVSSHWMTATIEAYGHEPERLIHALEGGLVDRLRTRSSLPSKVGELFLAGSALILLLGTAGWLLAQPQALAALRGFIERLPGG
ncbi:hypothetical protein [Singulisphaera acidiphila]|uniref:Uncharacterized protein n=1 Tax=Singulisphaera acidiphila (strain ATCC BAA-1392 / DSM 18658 / VKM B-2454 / MOB10) TaxID=886293 RepID=L0DCD4_SINAD|nr:hypothetical protein [Singulisphaera acidiphila]AGA26877.1 hypothetical protein Sinac_2575 [Singulisphaera acidiphila DSM 18658]